MASRTPLSSEERLRMSMPPESVGRMIAAKRVALGISQHEVARQMGVHSKTVQAWEKGKMDVNFVRLLNWILDGDGDVTEMWRRRALVAEATIRDVAMSLREWRQTGRSEAYEFRTGVVDDASSRDSSSPHEGSRARAA